jgi:hypothetical protein
MSPIGRQVTPRSTGPGEGKDCFTRSSTVAVGNCTGERTALIDIEQLIASGQQPLVDELIHAQPRDGVSSALGWISALERNATPMQFVEFDLAIITTLGDRRI